MNHPLQMKKRPKGFTLVELVVVIVLSGILAGMVTEFITLPVDAFIDQSRRAELVDIADGALDRMSRDIQNALPNSIRVACGGQCIEFLHAFGGGRYRASPPGNVLDFSPAAADTDFDWLGPEVSISDIVVSTGANPCQSAESTCLVVYNTGFGNGNAYQGQNVAAVTSAVSGSPLVFSFNNADTGFPAGGNIFPQSSPQQRFYLVDTPVSYICDPSSANTLRRYQGYSIENNHNSTDSHADLVSLGAANALLATDVSQCSFTYTGGTSTRNSLVSIQLGLTQDGESVILHQQVSVPNLP